jgi:glycosyltransferase involved in cell wall biosynthesis
MGDDIKFISSSIIMLALLARRRPVLLWGFGFHPYDKRQSSLLARLIAMLAGRLKMLRYRFASGYLAYTDGGANALRTLRRPPKHIAVLKNTIDTDAESRLRAAVASDPLGHMCHELGVRLNSTKLLYFGRLVPLKRVDLLVEYARRAVHTGRNLDIIIFGEGGDKVRLRSLASGLENMAFHVHDDLKLSRALRVSAAIVIPGAVGLAITHGFVHGVPTLTRSGQLHGPEIEYLQNGVNGLILPEALEAFFAGLDGFVRDLNLQHLLAEGAERSARAININCMVAAFHGLVSECLGSSAIPRTG